MLIWIYDWIWICGNYDFFFLMNLGGCVVEFLKLGDFVFCYEFFFLRLLSFSEVFGYFYLCVKVCIGGWLVRCCCFVIDGWWIIMFVFGVYMGGFNVFDLVYVDIFGILFMVWMMGLSGVYLVWFDWFVLDG